MHKPVQANLAEKPALNCHFGAQSFRLADTSRHNETEILTLFSEVFGESLDTDWLTWKHGTQTRGEPKSVGLWDAQGSLVAHYSGVPRQLYWESTAINAVQIGDVMVAPRVRGILSRRGPFFQVCKRFFDNWVGAEKTFQIAFGFPNKRHIVLGEKLDLYFSACDINHLTWQANTKKLPPSWRWEELQGNDKALDKRVNSLWRKMLRSCAGYVIGERDASYLRWRFIARPDKQYRIFCLKKFWLLPAALVITTQSEEAFELIDMIGDPANFPVAISAVLNEASAHSTKKMQAWASPLVTTLIGKDAESNYSGATVAIAKHSSINKNKIDNAHWWWMGGDTDFR